MTNNPHIENFFTPVLSLFVHHGHPDGRPEVAIYRQRSSIGSEKPTGQDIAPAVVRPGDYESVSLKLSSTLTGMPDFGFLSGTS
jgi:hypothetical protein